MAQWGPRWYEYELPTVGGPGTCSIFYHSIMPYFIRLLEPRATSCGTGHRASGNIGTLVPRMCGSVGLKKSLTVLQVEQDVSYSDFRLVSHVKHLALPPPRGIWHNEGRGDASASSQLLVVRALCFDDLWESRRKKIQALQRRVKRLKGFVPWAVCFPNEVHVLELSWNGKPREN
ncbi:hypothetical protein GOBAR_AA39338 [Gossypium barbadense]|uniref:Uncharacterized protein n=1 Tax=Gossypium barbadense TaxID=3634 RepID=A0A2P5VRB0_GOSBA|nr:hypothetical protein GOBAR_AA39338 [Gossypium barbadense]